MAGTATQDQAPLTSANLAAHNRAMGTNTTQPSTMQRWLAETDDHPTQGRTAYGWDQLDATDRLAAEIDRIVQDGRKSKKAGK